MTRGTLRDRPIGPEEERLFDLMRARAVEALDDDQLRELNQLAARHPDVDLDCYDRAAAALDIAYAERRSGVLPDELKKRIASAAAQHIRALPPATPRAARRSTWPIWSGWIAAAAATIVAIIGWTRELDPRATTAEMQRRVDAAADLIVLPWKPTEDPSGRAVAGELRWSTALQQGYMLFHGLPSNDPRREQYQLWIFDAPRGTDHPVDGGVFDVARGDVVVPIDAKIRVDDPRMFAVTAEQPGGVVVSKRERIVSLAQR